MILGIASLGEGTWRVRSKTMVWVVHMAGGALGGSITAAALWLALTPLRTFTPSLVLAAILGLILVWVLLIDLGVIRRPFRVGQVPSTWPRRFGALGAYWRYGLVLGSGLLVYVPHAATYSLFATAALLNSPVLALLAGGSFGLGRTLLIGPASFAADGASRILFRSSGSHLTSSRLSVLLTSLLATAVLFAFSAPLA